MISAAGVQASTAAILATGPGSSPRAALHSLRVAPVPIAVAKEMVQRRHYLHTLPGGTKLAFGVLLSSRLLGVLTLGVGPVNVHRLVEGASPVDCLTLTRFWLDDSLPSNSESRVMGFVVRALRTASSIRFLITYADPRQGHVGTIYQASNWLYTGLSETTPLYDIGDGVLRHSRTLSHKYGTRSQEYFLNQGVPLRLVPQVPKHRYVYFVDPSWRSRLQVPVQPYPKFDRDSIERRKKHDNR